MTAKEMFKELGYKYSINNLTITYESGLPLDEKQICFDLEEKGVYMFDDYEVYIDISVEELKAINKQIEELGWNNEIK